MHTGFELINYKGNGKYKLTSNKTQPGPFLDWPFIPCLDKSEICLGVDLIQSFRTFGHTLPWKSFVKSCTKKVQVCFDLDPKVKGMFLPTIQDFSLQLCWGGERRDFKCLETTHKESLPKGPNPFPWLFKFPFSMLPVTHVWLPTWNPFHIVNPLHLFSWINLQLM